MRRVMLLVFGLGAGGMMLLFLIGSVGSWEASAKPMRVSQCSGFYPRTVMGTDLLALELREYDGPFLEDGSNEEVWDVAALIVENRGGLLAVGGAVIVEMDDERLVFEFSFLPPGGKALVLEKDRKCYSSRTPITCYGWTREEYPENPGLISVDAVGLTSLTITNHTGVTVPEVEIHYKNYDREKGLFLGGISYCVKEEDLMPREIRRLEPAHFAARDSRIVRILQQMDR